MGTVTMLFTDLVGSTELLTRLGDDTNETVRRTHFRILRDAASEHGGEEVKNLGDGLMVVFSSAMKGIACAVTMQRTVAEHNRSPRGEPIGMRVGLHIGEPIADDGDYFGAAVVVAKRLCDVAESGQILVSDLVRAIVGGRAGSEAFRPLGPMSLKGIPEPIVVHEVEWRPTRHDVPLPPLLDADRAPLFGREDELARVGSGHAPFVVLAGEPGIGKTRLAAELARRTHADGGTVLYGRCDEHAAAPYAPWAEVVRYLFWSLPPEVGARFVAAPDLARIVPELPGRLGLEVPERPAEPDVERARLHDALVRFLQELAAFGSLLVVLDDLHWADAPSINVLRHVIRTGLPDGVRIIGTYRDIEVDRRHPLSAFLADARRDEIVDRVVVRGLDRDAIVALLEGRTGGALHPGEGRALADALHVETEGNPFFVREIVRHLVETGVVREEDGTWRVASRQATVGLPESVRDVVGRRLSLLSDTCNDVLRVASVIGREFTIDVVAHATDLSDDTVAHAVDEGVRARVVAETPGRFDEYAFTHMLIRETLYEELTTSRRVRLHQRIAEALESRNRAEVDVGALARHYREAAVLGDPTKAIEYARLAGERATAMVAYEEAAAIYDQTLQVLEAVDDRSAVGELLVRKGEALLAAGDAPAAHAALGRAALVAKEAGDGELLARAAVARGALWPEIAGLEPDLTRMLQDAMEALPVTDSPLRCRVLSRYVMDRAFTPEVSVARDLSADTLAMARRLGDPTTLAYAAIARRHVVTGPHSIDERLALSTDAVRIADALGDHAMALRANAFLQADATEVGDLALATQAADDVHQAAAVLRQPRYDCLSLIVQANCAHREGRFDTADELIDRAEELATHIGRLTSVVACVNLRAALDFDRSGVDADFTRMANITEAAFGSVESVVAMRSFIKYLTGDIAGARRGLDEFAAAGAPHDYWGYLPGTCFATLVAMEIGHQAVAQALHDALLPFADRHATATGTGLTAYMGPVASFLGGISVLLERYDDAVEWCHRGISAAEAMAALPARTYTLVYLARALVGRGDLTGARRAATEAREQATMLGMTRVLRQLDG